MLDIGSEFPEAAPDPAITRAERRLRLLERLTEIGMALAEDLRDQVMYPEACKTPIEDPADAFARISRAVRLTIALEAKTDQELRDLQAGVVRQREETRAAAVEHARAAAERACHEREDTAERLVMAVIEAESRDYEDFDGLFEALKQRLEEDGAYADCGQRPLRETVERMCHDLCLNPDWSHWTGEGWDEHYGQARSHWECFSRPSRTPFGPDTEPATPDVGRRLE